MNLLSTELFNFVTHKHSRVDWSKEGSYYIYAENLDNKSMNGNGSGKSLLLDGISWVQSGCMIRGGAAEGVIGNFAKHTHAVNIWKDDDRYIKIERFRKHPTHKNKAFIHFSDAPDKWPSDLDKDNAAKETVGETDDYISKLFKSDYDLFISGNVITKPRQELNFCEAKDTKRKEVLTNLLNLNWIDEAREIAKKEKNIIDTKMTKLDIKHTSEKHIYDDLKETLVDFRNERKTFETERRYQIAVAEDAMKHAVKAPSSKKILRTDGRIKKLRSLHEIAKKRASIISDLMRTQSVLYEKNERVVLDLDALLTEMLGIEKKILKIKKLEFSNGDICDHCGSEFSKKNHEILLQKYARDIGKNMGKQVKLENEKLVIERKIKTVIEQVTILESKKSINYYEDKIETAYSEIETLKIQREKYNNEKERISTLRKHVENLKAQISPWGSKINKTKVKLRTARTALVEAGGESKMLRKQLEDVEYAITAYGNSGIKNDIISSKIVLLEERINHYLTKITDGDITVQLDNKLQHGQTERIGIMIQDSKKRKPLDYSMWSGGEKTRIRFSIEWAINSIMESPINLLIVDEGFDDVDSVGIKRIVEVMRNEKSKKVIVISNRSDMKNIFNNSIKVVLENECSRVEKN